MDAEEQQAQETTEERSQEQTSEETTERQERQETESATKTSEETTEQQERQETESATKTYDEDYVKGLRRESASYRTNAKTLEADLKEARRKLEAFGELTAEKIERLRKRDDELSEYEQRMERDRIRSAFREQIDLPQPKMALGAALEAGIEIALDKDGKVENIEEIRKRIREENPAVFGDGSIDGGKRTPGGNGYDGPGGVGRLRHAYETQKT